MRRDPSPIWLTFALAAMLAAAPSAVGAQNTGTAIYGGSPSFVSLGVTVTARVSASCAFTTGAVPSGTYSVGQVDKVYSIDVPFSLRCNSPSRVAMVSANGGLLAESVASVPTGYARLAPYDVTLNLAGDWGVSAKATCAVATLIVGGGCTFRGPSTASTGLRLPGRSSDAAGSYIRISSTGYSASPILIASSSYADRLTVTISPAT